MPPANTSLEEGDKALNENKYQEALNSYQKALNENSENYIVYKKIAKAQFHLKDYDSSIKNYNVYLKNSPDDAEVWIELGEVQRQKGEYNNAITSFEKALNIEPKNDLAKRSILETQNNKLSCYNPEQAYREKQDYAAQNLKTAIQIAADYMSLDYMKDLADIKIQFGKTAQMGGTANIAQYENHKGAITVSDSYIYASPIVIAAYLIHESVHAKDKDSYTSVREEQDAYKTATQFWIRNSEGIQDPEMDYAASLYKKSPASLASRVQEIYELRDPNIAKTSPNHPPYKLFKFPLSKSKAASQPIKVYDVIA